MKHVTGYLRENAQSNFMDELRQGVDYGPEGDQEDYGLPWDDFIEDNIEETPQEEPPVDDTDQDLFPPEEPEVPEVPTGDQTGGYQEGDVDVFNGEEMPVIASYDDVNALIRDAILQHVIKIDYTTRHGVFTPDRIVEPHKTFTAATGNQILLTFDRTVGDIRGFIIGNIKPGGVLYENTFDVKPEIMRNRSQRRPVSKGSAPQRQVNKRR